MPCNLGLGPNEHFDWGSQEEVRQLEKRVRNMEAMLCGILRALEASGQLDNVLQNVVEKASGVSADVMRAWFEQHKRLDARRG